MHLLFIFHLYIFIWFQSGFRIIYTHYMDRKVLWLRKTEYITGSLCMECWKLFPLRATAVQTYDQRLLQANTASSHPNQLRINLFITLFNIILFWIQHSLKMDPKNVSILLKNDN